MHRPATQPYVLVDFDGTLCNEDVGNRFFRRFTRDAAAWQALIADWKADRKTARECLARECELADVSPAEADGFFDEFTLTPEATAFAAAAAGAGVPLLVASDGLDRYVERLLGRAGLALPWRANGLVFDAAGPRPVFSSGGPSVTFADGRVAAARPGADPGCGRCGNCKGALLEAARREAPERRMILIGDGFSDRCAARRADVVYAKDDLLAYCHATGIPARPFSSLREVAEAEEWGRSSTPRRLGAATGR